MRDEHFVAERGGGATLNGAPIAVSSQDRLLRSLLATGFPYDLTQAPGERRHLARTQPRLPGRPPRRARPRLTCAMSPGAGGGRLLGATNREDLPGHGRGRDHHRRSRGNCYQLSWRQLGSLSAGGRRQQRTLHATMLGAIEAHASPHQPTPFPATSVEQSRS